MLLIIDNQRWDFPFPIQRVIAQCIADQSMLVVHDAATALLDDLWSGFATVPVGDSETTTNEADMHLFEAARWAWFKLCGRFSVETSKVIGRLLVSTGRPDDEEYDPRHMRSRRFDFVPRLDKISELAAEFEKEANRRSPGTPADQIEKRIDQRVGSNCQLLCRG
jgi:hypothetical protein